MRQLWINKLNRAAGEAISTVVRDELIQKGETEVEQQDSPLVQDDDVEQENKDSVEEKSEEPQDDNYSVRLEMKEQPLISFSINVNESQLLKVLGMFFTK